jgi:hypothetical protein
VCRLSVFIRGEESELDADETSEFGRLFKYPALQEPLRDEEHRGENSEPATEFRNRVFTSKIVL